MFAPPNGRDQRRNQEYPQKDLDPPRHDFAAGCDIGDRGKGLDAQTIDQIRRPVRAFGLIGDFRLFHDGKALALLGGLERLPGRGQRELFLIRVILPLNGRMFPVQDIQLVFHIRGLVDGTLQPVQIKLHRLALLREQGQLVLKLADLDFQWLKRAKIIRSLLALIFCCRTGNHLFQSPDAAFQLYDLGIAFRIDDGFFRKLKRQLL